MNIIALSLSDLGVLHFFNGSSNLLLDQMALVLTSGLTWIPLYLVLFYIVMRNNETMAQIGLVVLGAILCVLLADGITDGIVKPMVGRLRPSLDPQVKYSIQVVEGVREKGFSFFSAHAANTMSIAVFFSLLIRSRAMTVMLVAWSLLNCWTRLYLGVHYPTDILCGALLGVAVGGLVYLLYRKAYCKISPDIRYVSNQYTTTGYDHHDIDVVFCVVAFTLVYVMLRSIVATCYI